MAVGLRAPPTSETGTGTVGLAFALVSELETVEFDEFGAAVTLAGDAVVAVAALVVALLLLSTEEALDAVPPNVKDWVASPLLHSATSRTFPLTARHFPFTLDGWKERGPDPPLNAKICEFVTAPPPSARPPQLKRSTWLPAARRSSKLKQALVVVLTRRVELATSMCFPAVMASHP